jgi:hypothetical protein
MKRSRFTDSQIVEIRAGRYFPSSWAGGVSSAFGTSLSAGQKGGAEGYRGLPHGGARRPRRAICRCGHRTIAFAPAAIVIAQSVRTPPVQRGANSAPLNYYTWGQNLHHHPHLHCVIPGGGIAPGRSRWIAGRRHFLLPV